MSREVHVRFCESRGVRFPPATRLENCEFGQMPLDEEVEHDDDS